MTLDEIMVRVRVAAEGEDTLDELRQDIQKFAADAVQATKKSANEQSMAWAAVAAAATVAFGTIIEMVNRAIDTNNKYTAAIRGLESVATSRGIGSEAMQQALDGVTDAFFDASAAATAYKNLLSRGYTLDQATTTITRLKDAAAYGRQASLSLKDAVVSATEGIRNENSILVDNAGVTKNVAKMWEDYAKAQGITTNSMTQAQKVEAEYQGILKETAAQVGDLQKMQGDLAGTQAEAAMQNEMAYRSLGAAMTPVVELGTEMSTTMLKGLTDAANACPELTAGLTSAATAGAGLIVVITGIKTAMSLASKVGLAGGALGVIGLIAAAVGVLVTAYTALKNAQEAAAKAEAERIQKNKEAVKDQQNRVERLNELTERYQQLSSKSDLGYSERKELVDIQRELAEAYDVTTGAMDSANASTQSYLQTLKLLQAQEMQQLADKQKQASIDARQATYSDEIVKAYQDYAEALKNYNQWVNASRDIGGQKSDWVEAIIANYKKTLDAAAKNLMSYTGLYADWFNAAVDEGKTAILLRGGEWNDALVTQLKSMFAIDPTQFGGDQSGVDAFVDSWIADITAACSDADISAALTAVQGVMQSVSQGLEPSEDQIAAFTEGWGTLLGEDSPLLGLIKQLAEATDEDVTAVADRLMQLLTGFQVVGDGANALTASADQLRQSLNGMTTEAQQAAVAMDWAKTVDEMKTSIKQLDTQLDRNAPIRNAVKTWRDLEKEFRDAKKSGNDTAQILKRMQNVCDDANVSFNGMEDGISDASKSFDAFEASMDGDAAQMQSTFASLQSSLSTLQQAAIIMGSAGMDTTGIESAIANVMSLIAALKKKAAAAGVTLVPTGGGGGGGGGGSKDDPEKAAEEARRKAIENDYALLDHRRHMNDITLKEYIAMLKEMYTKHKLTAEEIMELDEKIYDAEQELMRERTDQVDRLAEGVITALENRYQKMLDAELEKLDASRAAWQQWADESVAAIQAQIDALDELDKTEDREAKDAEELRKIAQLKQSIQFEQDAYNRAKLQQQLDAAEQARAERLRKQARDDRKEELQQQIEDVRKKAEDETAALDKKQDELEAYYAERMQRAALEAEAEKLLLKSTQKELLKLLKDYAPEYNATGQSLGERLASGFIAAVGDIDKWFKSFNRRVADMQANITAALQATTGSIKAPTAATPAAAGVTVTQTNNFNTPVETPSQTARRVAQANEALADDIRASL